MAKTTFKPMAAGLSLSATLGGLYAVCLLVYYLAPSAYFGIGKVLFHGVALSAESVSRSSAVEGLVGWLLIGFAAGWFFARLYNAQE